MKNFTVTSSALAKVGRFTLYAILEAMLVYGAYSFGHYQGMFDGVNHRPSGGSVWIPNR